MEIEIVRRVSFHRQRNRIITRERIGKRRKIRVFILA